MRAIACCVVLWALAESAGACPSPSLIPIYPNRSSVTSQPTIWVRGSELDSLRIEGENGKRLPYTIVEAHFASTLWIGMRVDIERGLLLVSTRTRQRRFDVEPLAHDGGFPRAEIEKEDRFYFSLMHGRRASEEERGAWPLVALGGLLAAAVIGRRAIN
jgi:hypothetical protein